MQDSLSCHCTPFPKWPANTWTTSLRKTGPANSRFFVSRPIDLGPNSKLADRSLAGFQMQPHPSNWFLFWLPPRWHNNHVSFISGKWSRLEFVGKKSHRETVLVLFWPFHLPNPTNPCFLKSFKSKRFWIVSSGTYSWFEQAGSNKLVSVPEHHSSPPAGDAGAI